MTSVQNRKKLTSSPFVRKMSALAHPLPFPCGLTINFEKSDVFFYQKVRTSASEEPPLPLVQKMSALDKPPDCGRDLWTAPNLNQN